MGDKNLLGFSVMIEIYLFFARRSKIDLAFVCGLKMTFFQCGDRLTWFLCGWSKWTWFLYAGRKSLGFRVNIEIDVAFVCVDEIDLISVSGIDPSKRTKKVRASNPSQR